MKRYFLIVLLSIVCTFSLAFGLAACNNGTANGDLQGETTHTHISGEAVVESQVDATCSQTGSYDSVVYCSECGEEISRETITIPMLEHTYSDYTCDENEHWHVCTVCGNTIASESHTFENNVCTVCGYEQLVASENLAYTLSTDGTYYTVSGIGTCTDTDIVIPKTYDSKPVTAIEASAFANQTQLISVYVPDSVTSIGEGAFSGCSSLVSMTMESGVKVIGDYAFYCTLIEDITLPDGVTTIGERAFYWTSLESITIPDSVTSIGDEAFAQCASLKSVTIGNGVTSIEQYMFSNCTSLESVTIPNSVTSIGYGAFHSCTALESIIIPDSVISIGSSAFYNCTSLESVTFENTNGWYLNNVFSGSITITSDELVVASTAATYLNSTYCNYYWYRSED